jgi:hypothetical protein
MLAPPIIFRNGSIIKTAAIKTAVFRNNIKRPEAIRRGAVFIKPKSRKRLAAALCI